MRTDLERFFNPRAIAIVGASRDLGKEPFRIGSASEQMAMVSVRGEEIVVGAETGNRRHAGPLLADIKMVVTAEHALVMKRH